MSILRSEKLRKVYKKRAVVKESTIEVKQGEIIGLLGPNGAGKTTTFYMIVGFVQPDQGKVFLDDKAITDEPMYKRARLGIGYLPQEKSVFQKLTVEDNILGILQFSSLSKKEQHERTEKLLEDFNIAPIRKSMGYALSGGERRRCEIARALALEPKFILLDEPFAGVDPIAVEDIQKIVSKLRDKNIGVLITDHNVDETLAITDRAYIMFDGAILKQGTPEELASDEETRRLYLGEKFSISRLRGVTDGSREKMAIQICLIDHTGKKFGAVMTDVSNLKSRDKSNQILTASRTQFFPELPVVLCSTNLNNGKAETYGDEKLTQILKSLPKESLIWQDETVQL
jgi:lipopolysaccharide export system ATP-binding protein